MATLMLLFATTTHTFNLPEGLLSSLCYVESGHVVNAISYMDGGKTDSLGICQVKLNTARYMGFKGTAAQLRHNPTYNVYYAGKYLSYQMLRYNGDIPKAVAAYNAGSCPHGVIKNHKYVSKVFLAWEQGL